MAVQIQYPELQNNIGNALANVQQMRQQQFQNALTQQELGMKQQQYDQQGQARDLEMSKARHEALLGVAGRLRSIPQQERMAAAQSAKQNPYYQQLGITPAIDHILSQPDVSLSDDGLDAFLHGGGAQNQDEALASAAAEAQAKHIAPPPSFQFIPGPDGTISAFNRTNPNDIRPTGYKQRAPVVQPGSVQVIPYSGEDGAPMALDPRTNTVIPVGAGRNGRGPPPKLVAKGGAFSEDESRLVAALAERNVNLPTGFRSQAQIQATLKGLIARNPGASMDEIADMIRDGRLALAADTKQVQVAGGKAGAIAVAQNEVREFAPLVLAASREVQRGRFVPWNQLSQMADTAISDPKLKVLKVQINALLNAYDSLAQRGGTDMNKRAHNREMISQADSPEALAAAVGALQNEAAAAERAAAAATRLPRRESAPSKAPVRVSSPAQAAALPAGTVFITPDGQTRVKH